MAKQIEAQMAALEARVAALEKKLEAYEANQKPQQDAPAPAAVAEEQPAAEPAAAKSEAAVA